MDEKLIKRARLYLGDDGEMLGCRVDEQWNVLRVVIDYGVKGTKVFNIPLADLPELPKPKPKPRAKRTRTVRKAAPKPAEEGGE
jgi:hypothetical protein